MTRDIGFARREKCEPKRKQDCEASLSFIGIKTWRRVASRFLELSCFSLGSVFSSEDLLIVIDVL